MSPIDRFAVLPIAKIVIDCTYCKHRRPCKLYRVHLIDCPIRLCDLCFKLLFPIKLLLKDA